MATPWYRRLLTPTMLEVPSGELSAYESPGAVIVAPGFQGRRAHIRWARNEASGLAGDAAMVTLDFVNITADVPDNSWTDADFQVVENAVAVWWTAIAQYYTANTILDQLRWYRIGPEVDPPQPAVRIWEYNTPGSASTEALPPQVAMSVTEKTAIRRRWGRMYLPAPAEITSDGNGRIVASVGNALANATQTLYETCFTNDFIPVVYSPSVGRAYTVNAIQVDDVFDVIRSRRHKVTLRRDLRPVAP